MTENTPEFNVEEVCVKQILAALAAADLSCPVQHFDDAATAEELPAIAVQATPGDTIMTRRVGRPLTRMNVVVEMQSPILGSGESDPSDQIFAVACAAIADPSAEGINELDPEHADLAFRHYAVRDSLDGERSIDDERRRYIREFQIDVIPI